ncbi:LysE family transporter [Erythrobacter arachoides]|uniref:LysE family transporter n=1 Tax=Aurantiacibacter arachoides TaxID=1850444 RepID=A0A845A0T0_9SPHN|nr:LysE family translocator [Aurantiacibacter arachoides]MXO93324.1 LysE family transporter [Aurantiacibacter arachoides]GGD50275.1 amino acid transporter LysE [Aurantiacibacter arachoides]
MIDPEKLVAFALVTGATSLVPGQSMLFVMAQAIWRGPRSGWAALLGMQFGYILWWVLAGLGLGTLAAAYPLVFHLLALAGATYLGWLGLAAIRNSFAPDEDGARTAREPSRHAFRDGIAVAVGNPKSLLYMLAILPPFVDPGRAAASQLVVLALVAMVIDLAIGALYIGTGQRLARFMERARSRRWIDLAIGAAFLLIAALVLIEIAGDLP